MPTPRDVLATRLRTLIHRETKLVRHLRREDGRLEEKVEDQAQIASGDETVERLDEKVRAEAEAIRAALARIEAGTWGTCTNCQDPIDAARLKAMPEAALCVPCAVAAEAQHPRAAR